MRRFGWYQLSFSVFISLCEPKHYFDNIVPNVLVMHFYVCCIIFFVLYFGTLQLILDTRGYNRQVFSPEAAVQSCHSTANTFLKTMLFLLSGFQCWCIVTSWQYTKYFCISWYGSVGMHADRLALLIRVGQRDITAVLKE